MALIFIFQSELISSILKHVLQSALNLGQSKCTLKILGRKMISTVCICKQKHNIGFVYIKKNCELCI